MKNEEAADFCRLKDFEKERAASEASCPGSVNRKRGDLYLIKNGKKDLLDEDVSGINIWSVQ